MLKVEGAQKVIVRENFEPRPLFNETTPICVLDAARTPSASFLDIAMKVSIRTDFAATIS